ncbi:MAG: RHS repeat protein, partial [Xanthomonadales bacterium PRO7]|nr:RHS repeat protein [Xanthomonadales bacterium PRO7]
MVNAGGVTESLTNWAYNTRGQTSARCEVDPAVSGASSYTCGASANAPTGVRQWSYTYCEQTGVTAGTCPLVGLLVSTDGPRTDVSDVTTYTYYQTTDLSGCSTLGAACHYLGDLYQVTNALGQVSTYVSYDKNGRVTRQQDANGVYTDMTYHPRGWLLTRTVRANANGMPNSSLDATTTFAYDNVGNVTEITQPDGAYLSYGYDAAHRLTDITDNADDHIHYTLDAAGNHMNESTYDPSSTLKRSLSRQYDQLNHLLKTLNSSSVAVQTYQNPVDAAPAGITYTDGYDGNGNAIYSVDTNGVGTEQQYDPLNRLMKTLQDHAGTGTTKDTTTQYAYDARDNLRSVTDPDNLVTNYTYDGLNNLTQLQSPDTGTTTYGTITQPGYDAASNRLMQTDANGITTTYSYDALNRLTGIAYPTTSLNVTYAYDVPATGCYNIGRLTKITDSSGSTTYCYDLRGNVLSKTQATADGSGYFTLQYQYTLADRPAQMTYPDGMVVSYGRDSVGRVTSVSYKPFANAPTSTAIVSNVSYYPFGPANKITFGNGRTLTKSYDQDYAIGGVASSDLKGLQIGAQVDAVGNLVNSRTPVGASIPTQQYQYDPLYRLTNVQNGNGTSLLGFTYDATGDRLSKTPQGQSAQSYAYSSGTHRLANVAGTARGYDANGNTTQIGGTAFSF